MRSVQRNQLRLDNLPPAAETGGILGSLLRGSSSVVEHYLAKVGVASSSLVSRSNWPVWAKSFAAKAISLMTRPRGVGSSVPRKVAGLGRPFPPPQQERC